MNSKSVKLLLVEDSPSQAQFVQALLKKEEGADFDIVWVERFSDALEYKSVVQEVFRLTRTSHRVSLRKEANDCRCEACGQKRTKAYLTYVKEFFFA